jgi:hypothetical protein
MSSKLTVATRWAPVAGAVDYEVIVTREGA